MRLDFSPLKRSASPLDIFRAIKTFGRRFIFAFYALLVIFVGLSSLSILFFTNQSIPDSNGAEYAFGLFAVMVLVGIGQFYRTILASVRVQRFASRNNLGFIHDDRPRNYPGILFRTGEVRIVDGLRTPNQLFYEFGNIAMLKNENDAFGYMRIKLPRELPNILLQAKKSRFIAADITLDQRLSLEGDFDKYFTLYAPKRYERDALYLFTPDVMMKFIETLGEFSSEIVADELYIFSSTKFSLTSQKEITLILEAAKTLTDKIDRQFARYKDEKMATPIAAQTTAVHPSRSTQIASGGQRLDGIPFGWQLFYGIIGNLILLAVVIALIYYSTKASEGSATTMRLFASVGSATLIASIIGTIKVLMRKR